MTTFYTNIESVLGTIWFAETEKGLCCVEIGGDEDALHMQMKRWGREPFLWEPERFHDTISQLRAYFSGMRCAFTTPIDWRRHTPFQRRVREAVMRVPYGETRTYGQIAREIGSPNAARAVGRANATNPLSIIIPCHRLIGADGALRGYRAPDGTITKEWLLALESSTSTQ